ncbi:MAG: serine/threonine protein kinase [Deltaproteobacteria bacterium]|nr:serine/threonine protein kinase [Deltaproteobacteria bacterium]
MDDPTNVEKSPAEDRFTSIWNTLQIDPTRRPGERIPGSEGDLDDSSLDRLPRLTGRGELPEEIELGPALGVGGTAYVHLARQLSLDRSVAVKTVRDERKTPEGLRALLLEAWVTGSLQHPNIVPVYALGCDDSKNPMLVMKHITGTSWRNVLRNPGSHQELIGDQDLLGFHLSVLMDVCRAVHFAHSNGIIHRDLKPDNVMIGSFGEVYVLDWGLAVSTSEGRDGMLAHLRVASSVRSVAGTPAYMAPEMLQPEDLPITTQTDVFLLGAILHEILTGQPPHVGKSLFEVLFSSFRADAIPYGDEVPGELARIARQAMHRDPTQRIAGAEVMRVSLREFSTHRQSAELTSESRERLDALEKLPSSADAVEIHAAYAAARFGFEHALKIWPENVGARAGLDATLAAMAEHELGHGAPESASALVASISDPGWKARFEPRLEAQREAQKTRGAKLEKLDRLERDLDLGVGAAGRSRLAVGLGAAFSVFPLAASFGARLDVFDVTWPLYLAQLFLFGGALAVGYAVARRVLTANALNRRVAASTAWVFSAVVVHRLVAFGTGAPLLSAFAGELVLYSAAFAILSATLDRALLRPAAVYAVALAAVVVEPGVVFEVFAIANFVAMFLTALGWRRLPPGASVVPSRDPA